MNKITWIHVADALPAWMLSGRPICLDNGSSNTTIQERDAHETVFGVDVLQAGGFARICTGSSGCNQICGRRTHEIWGRRRRNDSNCVHVGSPCFRRVQRVSSPMATGAADMGCPAGRALPDRQSSNDLGSSKSVGIGVAGSSGPKTDSKNLASWFGNRSTRISNPLPGCGAGWCQMREVWRSFGADQLGPDQVPIVGAKLFQVGIRINFMPFARKGWACYPQPFCDLIEVLLVYFELLSDFTPSIRAINWECHVDNSSHTLAVVKPLARYIFKQSA